MVQSGVLGRPGKNPMQHYRLYVLDIEGRVSEPPFEFEAESEESARRVWESRRAGRSVELWTGSRKIAP